MQKSAMTPDFFNRRSLKWGTLLTASGKTIALFRCTQMILYPT